MVNATEVNERIDENVEKTKGFIRRYRKGIMLGLGGAACYILGRRVGYLDGWKHGKGFGFGAGAAAACDVILDVEPEKRLEFMKRVEEAWRN